MMRVLALMKYGPQAATTRQRLLQYEPYLRGHGISIEMSSLLDDKHIARLAEGRRSHPFAIAAAYAGRLRALLRSRAFDVIWIHSELFPYLPGPLESLIAFSGRPIVYDYDDAIFHMYDAHPNSLVRRLLGKKLEPLLRHATVCLCGNPYLAAYASRFCEDSVIVPTVVDTAMYRPLRKAPDGAPIVGWIGSPSTWKYVEPLLPAILSRTEAAGGRFRAVGAGPRARGLPGIEAVDWSEESEIAEVQAFDIGIMPVPDVDWARGKCGYKLIQYMACGLPVVASPVGVNVEIVDNGWNGFLASGPREWQSALDRLLVEPALRDRMGRNGRARAEERYSLASQEPRVLAALTRAAERRRPSAPGAPVRSPARGG